MKRTMRKTMRVVPELCPICRSGRKFKRKAKWKCGTEMSLNGHIRKTFVCELVRQVRLGNLNNATELCRKLD